VKHIIFVLALASFGLQGCAKSTFANRLTMTLGGDRLFVNSLYGPVGITAELSAEDAAEIRRLMLLRPTVPVLLMPVQNAPPH
jgi:hypothetical protein